MIHHLRNFRLSPLEQAADKHIQIVSGLSLKIYLKKETDRGITDVALGEYFGKVLNADHMPISRHTIKNWKRHNGIVTVRRALSIHTV